MAKNMIFDFGEKYSKINRLIVYDDNIEINYNGYKETIQLVEAGDKSILIEFLKPKLNSKLVIEKESTRA